MLEILSLFVFQLLIFELIGFICENIDYFGKTLTGGDFNDDGFADLAISVYTEVIGTINHAGAVQVLYGAAGGLQAVSPDDQFWHQNKFGIKDVCEPEDFFGRYSPG